MNRCKVVLEPNIGGIGGQSGVYRAQAFTVVCVGSGQIRAQGANVPDAGFAKDYMNLGDLLGLKGLREEAQETYCKALETADLNIAAHPEDRSLQLLLVQILYRLHQYVYNLLQ